MVCQSPAPILDESQAEVGQELSAALEFHRQGSLARAARLYQFILAKHPDQVDALHLLGVVALQQGDPRRAIELIGGAMALCPGVALHHAHLADAYGALGQLERAAGAGRLALQLDPENPEFAHGLGNILMAQAKPEEAAVHFRAALRRRPDFAMCHNNLGNALRVLDDKVQALAHFREAVRIDPALAQAQSNLGQFLLEQGQPREALPHCRAAVRLRPEFPEALNNLGNVLRELGQLAEAQACYAEALRLNPHLAMTYNNMGQALQEEGKLDEAMAWYRQALQREPTTPRFLSNLASALAEQDRREEAVVYFRTALGFDPNYAAAHIGLGLALNQLGRSEEALIHLRSAVRLRPDFADAHANLGFVLEGIGESESSVVSLRAAIQHEPRHAAALSQLATRLRDRLPADELAALDRLLADPDVREGARASLHFARAHTFDARGAYAEATEHLSQANALRLKALEKRQLGYDPAEHSRFVDNLITTFTPELLGKLQGLGSPSERPVFIVGIPRSGTTLIEQILASHSQVFGAGELRLMLETFQSVPLVAGCAGTPLDCLPDLNGAALRQLAEQHLAKLHAINGAASRVTDKMPDNYLYLGLIAALFPRARVIHCRRDPRDVALSCWSMDFSVIRWASDPGHIAARFRDYQRLMDHYQRVLKLPLFELRYEDLVADLEGVSRRLVGWCGLDWEPGCLEFHRTRRPVLTASVAQVRKPLYASSVGRWRHYEQALQPLWAQLGCSTNS